MTLKQLEAERLETLRLVAGGHTDRSNGLCAMEVVAWMAGEPHSDHPACACPVIAAFMRSWNDSISTDEKRTRLLKPLLPLLLNTKSTPAIELQRSYMAFDWLVREHLPAWLEMTEALRPHAEALLASAPVTDKASLQTVMVGPLTAAWDAARDAGWDAARDAGWDAARDAAWAAARDAARDAAWERLRPTMERLEQSAVELVKRMCAVTAREER
jgi:hypothetical protein